MVGDGASTHEINYVGKFYDIINLEGQHNRITGSRAMAILLKGELLPIGGVASGSSAPAACAAGLFNCDLTFKSSIWKFLAVFPSK